MCVIRIVFDLMGDEIVELSAENESLKMKQNLRMKIGYRNLKQTC